MKKTKSKKSRDTVPLRDPFLPGFAAKEWGEPEERVVRLLHHCDSWVLPPRMLPILTARGVTVAKKPELVFVDLLRSPRIDSQPGGSVRQPYLSYRPDRLHRLAKSIHRNRFLGSINVFKYGLWARICKSLRCSEIDSHPDGPIRATLFVVQARQAT
jgi:hypothetical protein